MWMKVQITALLTPPADFFFRTKTRRCGPFVWSIDLKVGRKYSVLSVFQHNPASAFVNEWEKGTASFIFFWSQLLEAAWDGVGDLFRLLIWNLDESTQSFQVFNITQPQYLWTNVKKALLPSFLDTSWSSLPETLWALWLACRYEICTKAVILSCFHHNSASAFVDDCRESTASFIFLTPDFPSQSETLRAILLVCRFKTRTEISILTIFSK
jgi:hypothetical protein